MTHSNPLTAARALLENASVIERDAARASVRLPVALSKLKRDLRVSLFRAASPDVQAAIIDQRADDIVAIAQGRAAARAALSTFAVESVTPEILAAADALRAAVARCEAVLNPRPRVIQPRRVAPKASA